MPCATFNQWCILVLWSADVRGCCRGVGAGFTHVRRPARENFSKTRFEQGLLVHSEKIVKGGVDTGFLLYLLN